MARKPFTDEQKADILAQWEAGAELKAICTKHGRSNTYMLKCLEEWGAKPRIKRQYEPREPVSKRGALYKSTPCRCPKCGKQHELTLFWSGVLPARKYCKPCRLSLSPGLHP